MDLEIYFGIKYQLQNIGVKYDSNEGAWFSKHRGESWDWPLANNFKGAAFCKQNNGLKLVMHQICVSFLTLYSLVNTKGPKVVRFGCDQEGRECGIQVLQGISLTLKWRWFSHSWIG